jgi:hypothetical protein
MKIRNGIFALLAVISLGACGRTADEMVDGMPAPLAAPAVSVTNTNWADVNVFAVSGGQSHRLGMVTTNQTTRFDVPEALRASGDFRIVIEPIGSSERFVASNVLVGPGQELVINVHNVLQQSTVTVQ